TTLSTLCYFLAVNQECQARLFEEVKAAFMQQERSNSNNNSDKSQRYLSYEILTNHMPYLDACISESLRLLPPALNLERQVKEDYLIPNSDPPIVLPKGGLIEVSVFGIHHSEEYYPNASQFNPDRFLPENKHLLHPYTFLPFGDGLRNCIGMRFALFEVKLCMTQFLSKYKLVKGPNTQTFAELQNDRSVIGVNKITVAIEK